MHRFSMAILSRYPLKRVASALPQKFAQIDLNELTGVDKLAPASTGV